MAVAFDAATEAVRTGVQDPFTFTHTPVGTPRGIIVSVAHGTSSTDHVVGITYGGVALSRINTARDTATEPARVDLWFLGTGIPAGAQTVSVDLATATTDDIQFVCISFTAAFDTKIQSNGILENDRANPSITLAYGGRTCIAIAVDYTGTAAPGTPGANTTLVHDHDFGAFGATVIRQTTSGSADFAISVTHALDDCAYAAAAITEKLFIGADAGSYSTVGTAASLLAAHRLQAATAAYTLVGSDAALRKGFIMAAASGVYAVIGQDAALRAARRIAADPGVYALVGSAATLRAARKILVDAGAYVLSGSDVILTFQGGAAPPAGSHLDTVVVVVRHRRTAGHKRSR